MKILHICAFTLTIIVIIVNIVESFVFDPSNKIILKAKSNVYNRKTHFGYSLDLSVSRGKVFALVGSPKDGIGVEGYLWACPILYPNLVSECQTRPNGVNEINNQDILQDQLLGATVLAVNGKEQNEVWACAPRFQRPYRKNWANDTYEDYMTMLGQCFVYSGNDEFQSYSKVIPLTPQFYNRQGFPVKTEYVYGTIYSELGMSIHYDPEQGLLFFGAPGTWNWTGTAVVTDTFGNNPILTQPWSVWNPKLNDYSGYSLTSGNVVPAKPRQLIMGAPRAGESRTGAIFIVGFKGTELLDNSFTVNGRQPGEYFGASTCTVDLNGDGIMEIIVGAPLYINNLDNNRFKLTNFEEGRIGILTFDKRNKEIREVVSISGTKNGGRFGQSLASLGDLDGDGLGDFAVGSPYENEGQGAIRIFFGRKKILQIQDPLQTIEAANLEISPRGFGVSFSFNQVDVDGNNLEDLAVGAHLSSHAFVLLRKPVVGVDLKLTSSLSEIDTTNLKAFSLKACVILTSNQSSQAVTSLTLNVTVDPRTQVVFGKTSSNWVEMTVLVNQGQEKCHEIQEVRLKSNRTSAVEPPLKFFGSLKQDDSRRKESSGVLDPRKKYETSMEIPFARVCGVNGNCHVDLQIKISSNTQNNQFVIGSRDTMEQIITVWNRGINPAYQTYVTLYNLPKIGIVSLPNDCKIPKDEKLERKITCNIPNPISTNGYEDLKITYNMTQLYGGQKEIKWYSIEAKVPQNSGSVEENPEDNEASYAVSLTTEADVKIFSPKNSDKIQEGLAKRNFAQTYQIINELSSPIKDLYSWVNIPTHFKNVELVEVQSVQLNLIGCDRDKTVNVNAESENPKDFSCSTKDVKCVTYRCPKFELKSNNSRDASMLNVDLLIIQNSFFELFETYTTDGHVRFPETMQEDLKAMNREPDDVNFRTEIVKKVSLWSSANIGLILMIALPALVVFLLILFILHRFGCLKRKKVDETAFQGDEMATFMKNPDESEDKLSEQFPDAFSDSFDKTSISSQ